ncbi:MAG: 2-keto-4-pentenoate hydratase-like protein [Ramlibacter sp.]|jgi:2-keto-4-pentenoate hydratase|nr:2-keto-4-pentenoate hydratase-like protein [Ramlibacter sp.]
MPSAVRRVADALLQARLEHQPADADPLENLLQDPEDAYAVQDIVAHESGWLDEAEPGFWKSGGKDRGAPLTHAPLPPQNVWPSPAAAGDRHFNVRWIEAEVALRLGREVTAAQARALGDDDAPSLVDGMTVSIEVVDSRWRQARKAATLLKLADLQSHGALVLGEWQPFAPRDWSAQACTVEIGRQPPQTFTGSYGLADPAWLLPAWLRHVTREGATVPGGTIVTTGTWCGLLDAQKGDRVKASFPGIGTAELQL